MIDIGGNQRARGLVNMVDGVEHANGAPTTFVELSNTWDRALSWWNTMSFRFTISGRFCSIAVFSNSSNWKQYFSEFTFRCLVKGHNTGSLSNPTRHRAWLSLDEDRLLGWLKVIHSAFPKIFFAQHYCKWSIFHPPSLLASKMVSPRCVYRASRKWKCDPDFSPLNQYIKTINTSNPYIKTVYVAKLHKILVDGFDIFNIFANLRVV